MRIFSRATLRGYWEKHRDAEENLRAWFTDVEKAAWTGPQDIKTRYSTASFVGGDRVVFNINGNSHRLIVAVRFDIKLVLICFVGTHAEYDRINAEEV